ncbi:MAG TPA: metalloprotease family protein [Acetivibrio sp.]|uniref:metalloprotease family protein n=1 Tax=Acetivibrio sp. TaxID=1872092 RepID=UPI002CC26912|nr:metalloprotease family protein [Acetivibrio sp.]HOM03811.1 metalloprotease family protein [Acetivibrio sp.]
MLIPGIVISALTFPGVIVHEMAHQLFCRLSKVAVLDVRYFQLKNPSGYVIHEVPKKSWQNILIGIGPFIINTLVGAVIASGASIPVFKFDSPDIFDIILIWLGVSIAMHSFPSTGDAANIWKSVKDPSTPILVKILTAPLVGLIYLCALGSVVWLDLLYGIAVALLIPNVLISLVA